MLSQLMLLVAVAAASTYFSNPAFADFELKGTGVYRSEQGCLRVLPEYSKRLESMGFTLTKPMECIEVQGEIEAYEPTFYATSEKSVVAETAVAAPLQDEPSCKASLRTLLHVVVTEPGERVLESGCVPMSVSDYEQGELIVGQYQPMVILLKTKPSPASASTMRLSPDRSLAGRGQKLHG